MAKAQRNLSLILLAILNAFMGLASSAAVQASSESPFGGTTWVSIKSDGGAVLTIAFAADGSCTDHWKNKLHEGKWQANAANTEVVITLNDGHVFHCKLDAEQHLVRDHGGVVFRLSESSTNAGTINSFVPPKSPPALSAEDQVRAVVLIKGDNAEGTGFLVKMPDGPVVVTNIHVISNNPNLKITTNTGSPITILSYKGATDRDLAMIAIKDGSFNYLPLAADVSGTVQSGDKVITPGNSEGGEVMLNTTGKVLGIGPDRIEFDNPVYHGNSGGPVIHVNSGKVIGVVAVVMKVLNSDELDKASFANRNSAIRHSMRYFGLRLDTVPSWEPYDWNRLQSETAFLDQFDKRSRCLDSFLNTPASYEKKSKKKKSENINEDDQDASLWRQDDKIVKANNDCFDQRSGADTSQQVDAIRTLWAEISDIAGIDMDTIQNANNFYSFDRQRAKDEIAYRKAIKAELDQISNNVSRLGSLPRTNRN